MAAAAPAICNSAPRWHGFLPGMFPSMPALRRWPSGRAAGVPPPRSDPPIPLAAESPPLVCRWLRGMWTRTMTAAACPGLREFLREHRDHALCGWPRLERGAAPAAGDASAAAATAGNSAAKALHRLVAIAVGIPTRSACSAIPRTRMARRTRMGRDEPVIGEVRERGPVILSRADVLRADIANAQRGYCVVAALRSRTSPTRWMGAWTCTPPPPSNGSGNGSAWIPARLRRVVRGGSMRPRDAAIDADALRDQAGEFFAVCSA